MLENKLKSLFYIKVRVGGRLGLELVVNPSYWARELATLAILLRIFFQQQIY